MNINTKNYSLQGKEQIVVETILSCTSVINKLKNTTVISGKSFQLFETQNYFSNMTKLFETVTGSRFSGTVSPDVLKIQDFRFNNYAYLNEVSKFLVDFDLTIVTNLNESLNFNDGVQYNIDHFTHDLHNCIKDLENIDDLQKLDTLSPEIRKIKIWARKPLYVYGFDIVNNYALQKELIDSFGIDISHLITLLFDRTNKQLLFIFTGRIIAYDIKNNLFGDYNEINKETIVSHFDNEILSIKNIKLINNKNYKEILADEVNNNMLQLYLNVNSLELKFTDNLYGDSARAEWLEKHKSHKDNNMLVKNSFSTVISK